MDGAFLELQRGEAVKTGTPGAGIGYRSPGLGDSGQVQAPEKGTGVSFIGRPRLHRPGQTPS